MTSIEWSDLSNHLYQLTLVAYVAALIGFALEYAYGNRGAIAAAVRPAPVGVAAVREPALVGASAGGPRDGLAALPDPTAAVPGDAESRRWPAVLGVVAMVLTVLGWGLHAGAVLTRAFASGHVPWGNMYEFSMAVSLVAVTVYLVLALTKQVRYLGVWVLTPVVIYLLIAGMALYSAAGPLVPILSKSYWLLVHVTAALTATGALMVGGVVALLHLLRRRYEALVAGTWTPNAATQRLRRTVGADPLRIPDPSRGLTSLAARLAPAKSLDRVEYRLVAFAFPVWTFAVIAGAVWAESAWGRYWGWDPKETWSFVTWLVYAAYLHARTTAGWRKWASTISLVAFSCLMANYFLINLVFVGKHSYGGVKETVKAADVCQISTVGDACRTMLV